MTKIYSSLLDGAGFPHGFGTRIADRQDFPPDIHILVQVHGDRIVCLTDQTMRVQSSRFKVQSGKPNLVFRGLPERSFRFDEGDALLTALPGVSIGIRTADCLPVLVADPASKTVAAVHCGWRSLALELPARVAQVMTSLTGAEPAGFLAALGPAINICCYEVGREVMGQFRGGETCMEPATVREGRHFLDLRALARSQLQGAGLLPEHIDDIDRCTSCEPALFYSHRARKDEGRMVSFITVRG